MHHIPLELTDGVAASDLAGDTDELVPTAKPKGIYGRSGYPKGSRQERPTKVIVEASGTSWWLTADPATFTAEAKKRMAPTESKDFIFYKGMGDSR